MSSKPKRSAFVADRAAQLAEVKQPYVREGAALGVVITLTPSDTEADYMDIGSLKLFMTPAEAMRLAADLISASEKHLARTGAIETLEHRP